MIRRATSPAPRTKGGGAKDRSRLGPLGQAVLRAILTYFAGADCAHRVPRPVDRRGALDSYLLAEAVDEGIHIDALAGKTRIEAMKLITTGQRNLDSLAYYCFV
jgi:hypothetical protein